VAEQEICALADTAETAIGSTEKPIVNVNAMATLDKKRTLLTQAPIWVVVRHYTR